MKEIITRLKAIENLPVGEYEINTYLPNYLVTKINTNTSTVMIEDMGVWDEVHISEIPIEEQAFIYLSLYKFLR
jgi:hypothetical protein